MNTTFKIPHFCYEWDGLFIRPGDPEMDCCNCCPEWTVDEIIKQYGDSQEENQKLIDENAKLKRLLGNVLSNWSAIECGNAEPLFDEILDAVFDRKESK